jgi:VWFA-related protein
MNLRSLSFRAALGMALLAAMLTSPLWAQQSAQDNKQEPMQTLKVDVNVVNLYFNVKDGHGALVPSLTRDDFQVFEDGKPQTIKYFTADVNQPLTLGILIDTSASQERVLLMEKEVGADFLRDVLRPKDLAFLISFDVNVDLLKDFTNSPSELGRAMQTAKINNGGGGGGGLPGLGGGPVPISNPRGTLLYDAVYLASEEKLAREVGRKAMIILTDGEDQGSKLKIRDAIESAQKADSICYVLLIADRGFYGGMGYSGDRAMKDLAEQTGGRVIDVGKNEKKLKEAFDQIAAELRTQYSVGYTPTNQKRDGSFRKVEIKSKANGTKVQTRAGYYAPLPNGQSD